MITKYDIEYENKNVILIVNLDFYYEFSNFDYKEYTKNLRKEIEKLAKKHNAKKVKIVIGGVLLSTLLLTPQSNIESKVNTFITNNTIKETINTIPTYDDYIIIDVSKPNNEININDSNKNNNIVDTPINKDKVDIKENPSNKVINTNNININKNENIKDKEEQKEIIDTNTYVIIHRNNGSILKLELEEYLIGVVGCEMPASFNIEALKSQAIFAITYALKRIKEGKNLTDTVSTQSYKDNNELKIMWGNDFDKYYNKVKTAVINTKGIALIYNNDYIDAVYHSTSNGKTEDAINVWGYDIPYLKSVDSNTDTNSTSYKKSISFSYEYLSNTLNTAITRYSDFILERNLNGRVNNVKINDIEIKGISFRNLLGLRSTDFKIELTDENIIITTYGYGHGVGMSQYGANGLANKGYNYEQILKHYYKNVTLKKI